MRETTTKTIRELAVAFLRMKQASLEESEATSLDPQPALPDPIPKETIPRKKVRRVFPFKRYLEQRKS